MWCFILFALYYYVFLTTYIYIVKPHTWCDAILLPPFLSLEMFLIEYNYYIFLPSISQSRHLHVERTEERTKTAAEDEEAVWGHYSYTMNFMKTAICTARTALHKCIFDDEVKYPFTALLTALLTSNYCICLIFLFVVISIINNSDIISWDHKLRENLHLLLLSLMVW